MSKTVIFKPFFFLKLALLLLLAGKSEFYYSDKNSEGGIKQVRYRFLFSKQLCFVLFIRLYICTCRTVVSLQSCSWNVQWNPALRPARSDKTTYLLRPYSFKPNVKTIESFYYFKDPVNGTTSLLRFYGPTVVALTGFHCICFIDLWQVPFPQDENKNLEPFFSNFFTNRKN